MPTLISSEHLSETPEAIRSRARRLHNDAYVDSQRQINKLKRNKEAIKKIIKKANGGSAFSDTNRNKYLTTRIAHHLSRGRSIADIVVRENAPVSLVRQLVKAMEVVK